MWIFFNLILTYGSSKRGYTLIHNHTIVHPNREVATPLSTITLMHLLRRETGLSSVKVRPGRTSYCALVNVTYFTIYFTETNGDTENIWRRTNHPPMNRFSFPPMVADGSRYRHTYTHIGRIRVLLLSCRKSLGKKIATVRVSRNRSIVTDRTAHRRAPAP